MSTYPHNYGEDSSRSHQAIDPESVPGPSRETVVSPAIATRESSSAPRATYTSYVRNEDPPSRSLSESQGFHDAHERVHVELDGAERRKISTTFSMDQGSKYAREGEVINIRDESHFRPPKEEDRYRYDRDRTDDKRDTPRETHHPSLKEKIDISRPPRAHAKDTEPISPASTNFQHVYEAQSRELSLLRHEHQRALDEQKRLRNACVSLEQQCEERTKKLGVVRRERQRVRMQRDDVEDAYAVLRQQCEEQAKELNAVRHERHTAVEQKQKAEEDYNALRQKYEAQKHGYSALRQKYHASKATLEQRTSELQGIQKFLTTADKFSGSEVVNSVRKLNEDVQQSTTFMAEWVVERFMLETPPTDEMSTDEMTTQTIEQTRTSEALGMGLMQLLGTKKYRDNSILVEMALRAYLIYELYWIASQWGIGQEEQSHNVYINGIYQRMRDAEGQAISGNWRALTRAYMLPGCISDPELGHKFQMIIISGFSEILLAAGCTATKSDVTSGLWSKFAEKIGHFVSLAGEVNKIIGVGVISEDFEVQVVRPEAVYDQKTMEDSYDNGDRREEQKETVLCATELGLVQRMRVGAGGGQDGEPSDLIIMKPKVALLSVIDIIDE